MFSKAIALALSLIAVAQPAMANGYRNPHHQIADAVHQVGFDVLIDTPECKAEPGLMGYVAPDLRVVCRERR